LHKKNNMAQVYIVCGIDTDCGKTYITGLLAKQCIEKGQKCITQKLVQTGCTTDIADDIREHRRIMQIPLLPEDYNHSTNPYVFKFPASPHLAAQLESATIDISILQQHIHTLAQSYDIVLSEAAGGLCVPLTPTYLFSDFIQQSGYPIILVSSSKLGSINHTLLSIEFCKTHNITIHAIVYNVFPDSDPEIAESSCQFLETYCKQILPATLFVRNSQIKAIPL